MRSKQFGGKVTKEELSRLERSDNFQNGKFQNLEETTMKIEWYKIPGMIYKQVKNSKDRVPKEPFPVIPFNKDEFLADSAKAKMIWYGHSAILMRMNGKTLFIDPMMGPNASPIAPFKTKRFSENTLSIIDDLPEIDLLLMSHDHYDHLDYDSMKKLIPKTREYYVAMGVKRHLVEWGADPELITEFDWWNYKDHDGIEIHFTPSRHFSGRGLKDREKSLWGGWVFKSFNEKIWFSGDGGYGKHFKEIGEKFGGFDLGFIECGQYGEDWPLIHMFPEEAVRSALDARVAKAMPVHWGGFALSYQHNWYEPVDGFTVNAVKNGLDLGVPSIGEVFTTRDLELQEWWKG